MKNILITGGLGYVGGRLASYLAARHPLVNIFLTTSKENPVLPEWAKNMSILEMNLENPDSIRRCFQQATFDAVVHLAALNEIDSLADPLRAYHVNTLGTYHLADAARKCGVTQFIYFSTFHVYGATTPDAVITERTPTFATHPYATTHRAAEDVLAYFRACTRMKTLVFRLSNGYGYPMDAQVNRWTLVANDLCRQAVRERRMVLRTSGRQHRNFIALADIAKAVELFLYESPNDWGDGLFNLGGDSSMSILEMANRIADCYENQFGSRPDLVVDEKSTEKEQPVVFSIDKLKAFGFVPAANLEEEILRTFQICRMQDVMHTPDSSPRENR